MPTTHGEADAPPEAAAVEGVEARLRSGSLTLASTPPGLHALHGSYHNVTFLSGITL